MGVTSTTSISRLPVGFQIQETPSVHALRLRSFGLCHGGPAETRSAVDPLAQKQRLIG